MPLAMKRDNTMEKLVSRETCFIIFLWQMYCFIGMHGSRARWQRVCVCVLGGGGG